MVCKMNKPCCLKLTFCNVAATSVPNVYEMNEPCCLEQAFYNVGMRVCLWICRCVFHAHLHVIFPAGFQTVESTCALWVMFMLGCTRLTNGSITKYDCMLLYHVSYTDASYLSSIGEEIYRTMSSECDLGGSGILVTTHFCQGTHLKIDYRTLLDLTLKWFFEIGFCVIDAFSWRYTPGSNAI